MRDEDNAWPNVSSDKTILSLDTFVKPNTHSYLVPFGTYHLKLVVSAGNAEPINRTIEISLTGDWYDDERKMLDEGIGVRVL